MPARLRGKTDAQTESSQESKAYNIPGLNFDKPLSWRPGKAIPVAELLSRLQDLSNQLRSYEEDQVDSQQWTSLAQDLAHVNLLGHKDKGIRAWAISSIVEVLKICAPDAPFLDHHLKDIFTVIINSILPALADPNNAYNIQHVYILSVLSESQSILLLADIENPDPLIEALFTHVFDIFADPATSSSDHEVSKSVEYHMKNMLCTVVEEVDLPAEVTDIIISQFLRVDLRTMRDANSKSKKQDAHDKSQSTLLMKDYPPAYNMAKAICTTCQEKMTAQITQYFNAVIVDAGAVTKANGHSERRISGFEDETEDQEQLADLRKAHRLLRELWRACPEVLINVIPQLEAELSADAIILRQLATETLGDIAAGIGIAGLPPSEPLDPAAFPLPSIALPELEPSTLTPLNTPASPKPFATVYRAAYQNLMGRKNDKAPAVRKVWAEAAARILCTSAGGIGLASSEQEDLLEGYAQTLRDPDEHVRQQAIRSVRHFSYHSLVNVLGSDGGLAKSGSVFSTLAERFTDRKYQVREEAISFASSFWGVASGDIEEGNTTVNSVIGSISSRLLSAYFTNDPHIHALLYQALYDNLIPTTYPPIKGASSQAQSQKRKSRNNAQESEDVHPDAIRARRILTLLRSLDTRSKQVFLGMQSQQSQIRRAMNAFLKACEIYNGGIMEEPSQEQKVKEQLKAYIGGLCKPFSDPAKMSSDLWKFAETHDRRSYQLIRFATGPENDYKTVTKAMKELHKRLRDSSTTAHSMVDSIMPLIYRCALLVYNRSHVPPIMDISRTDEHGLANAAHELLQEISTRNPEVLKTHIQALCDELEQTSPSTMRSEASGAADSLKACAHFARKYPTEISKDRKFLSALMNFALLSESPRASKHAVTIILTIADRKEMYARDIISGSLKDCQNNSPHFLSHLAAIAQVCLLAPAATSESSDVIHKVATKNILYNNESPKMKEDDNAWSETPDTEVQAKELALRILVNQCRSLDEKQNAEEFEAAAKTVLKILIQLISENGEITPTRDTSAAQRNRLRLVAAHSILKLCSHKRRFDELLTPAVFETLALIVVHPPNAVRRGFVIQIKKSLGHKGLSPRWLTVLFLLAFELDYDLQSSTVAWLKSRLQYYDRFQTKSTDKKPHQNVMESIFARLLSLLAHHPDYPAKDDNFDAELLDFSKYITFYLLAVATEKNISLIFHIAQRIKQTQDNVVGDDETSERLYVLSDLAQAIIRNYADMMPGHSKGGNLLQTWPGQVSLPSRLFKPLPGHNQAQKIAEKNYLPEDVAVELEKTIKDYTRSLRPAKLSVKRPLQLDKKRKSATSMEVDGRDEDKRPVKKKKSSLPIRRTPKAANTKLQPVSSPVQPSRKSTRVSTTVSYFEGDSDEDDVEMAGIGKTRSSPVASRSANAKGQPSPEMEEADDVEMDDDAVQVTEKNVKVHEDDDAVDNDEDEVQAVASSPPLKERENTPGAPPSSKTPPSRKGRARAGSGKQAVDKPPPRPTRQSKRVNG